MLDFCTAMCSLGKKKILLLDGGISRQVHFYDNGGKKSAVDLTGLFSLLEITGLTITTPIRWIILSSRIDSRSCLL